MCSMIQLCFRFGLTFIILSYIKLHTIYSALQYPIVLNYWIIDTKSLTSISINSLENSNKYQTLLNQIEHFVLMHLKLIFKFHKSVQYLNLQGLHGFLYIYPHIWNLQSEMKNKRKTKQKQISCSELHDLWIITLCNIMSWSWASIAINCYVAFYPN
jgi:hypothetical protein